MLIGFIWLSAIAEVKCNEQLSLNAIHTIIEFISTHDLFYSRLGDCAIVCFRITGLLVLGDKKSADHFISGNDMSSLKISNVQW